jgi:transposase
MGNPRARYTQEFMIEAVRMVRGGQSMAAVAKILGISPKTLHNWVKADAAGKLSGAGKQISPEQMEIARLRAELARMTMERDVLKNRRTRLPAPLMNRNSGRVHCMHAETVAVSSLEV